ncbi:MAG: GGDEF domain-containing protein [Nitrospirota bacterium]
MRTFEIITTLQILAGTVIILLSIVNVLKSRRAVPENITSRRLIALSFGVLFVIGFVFSFLSLFTAVRFPFELLSGTLFLGSACFVYMAFKITTDARDHLEWKTSRYKRAEDRFRSEHLRDDLTGLYSKNGFIALIESHIRLAQRQKKSIILFYADIDGLKGINENFGHQEGDMMLKEAADVLRATFRRSDIMARIGEDEFAVLLIESSENHMDSVNDHFRQVLDEYNSKRHQKYRLSMTAGVTSYSPEYNDSVRDLLEHVYELAGGDTNCQETDHAVPDVINNSCQ